RLDGCAYNSGTELFRAVFGNPTRAAGHLRGCLAGGRFAHRWQRRRIDSRSVAMTNKAPIEIWMKDHGEDSDFIRTPVRGVFARGGWVQFNRRRAEGDRRSPPAGE